VQKQKFERKAELENRGDAGFKFATVS